MAGKTNKKRGVADVSSEPQGALARARFYLAAGNVRAARAAAQEAVSSGPEAEREEARALLERTAPDRRSLVIAAIALLLIVFATWAAILHRG